MEDFPRRHPEVLIVLLPFGWALVMHLIARLTGWAALADVYQTTAPRPANLRRFQSIQTRWLTHYGNVVNVGLAENALYFSLLLPFRPGHPPLLIPLAEVTLQSQRYLGKSFVALRFVRVPNVVVFITLKLAQELKQAAGASWPREGARSLAVPSI